MSLLSDKSEEITTVSKRDLETYQLYPVRLAGASVAGKLSMTLIRLRNMRKRPDIQFQGPWRAYDSHYALQGRVDAEQARFSWHVSLGLS